MDSWGRIRQAVCDGHSYEYIYNDQGLLKEKRSSGKCLISYEYDKAGQITKMTDPAGIETLYEYGLMGRTSRIFNLDDLFPSEPLLKTPWGSIGEKNILSRGIVENIRSANTDKTDAEMLLLFAAGGAQVLDDKDVVKYISSMMKGNWGDNEIDPQFVSEGVDDHYRSKGMDKSEIIWRERD